MSALIHIFSTSFVYLPFIHGSVKGIEKTWVKMYSYDVIKVWPVLIGRLVAGNVSPLANHRRESHEGLPDIGGIAISRQFHMDVVN